MVKPSDIYANPAVTRAKAVTVAADAVIDSFKSIDEEFNTIIRLLKEAKRGEKEIAEVEAMQTTFREVSKYNVPALRKNWSSHLESLNRNRN